MLALALASFGIGTTEYVIMGLLPSVAQDLSVSIPQAGITGDRSPADEKVSAFGHALSAPI